jgi:hypothetical protein
MRKLVRLAVLIALAVWAWRHFLGGNEPLERATIAYADGSAVVVEPGSQGFDRLAATARTALR